MPADSVNIKYLAGELNRVLSGGRIDKITMPEMNTVILTIRSNSKNHSLLLCANPMYPRCHLTNAVFENPLAAPAFLMHLRKHLSGGRINSVSCTPFERVINISLTSKSELAILEERTLIIEIMGKHSNIILVNSQNIISESIRHITPDLSSKRIVLPGARYAAAPAQSKVDCSDELRLSSVLGAFEGGNLTNYILNNVSGFAASTINEVIFKVLKKKNPDALTIEDSKNIAAQLCGIYNENEIRPCVNSAGGGAQDFYFRPYLSAEGAEYKFFDTLSEAAEYFYIVGKEASLTGSKAKSLTAAVTGAVLKTEKRLAFTIDKIEECADAEKDKLYGELITANIYKIKKGFLSIRAENYYEPACPLVDILLDSTLSPQANAQKYYKKYNKKKKTLESCNAQKLALIEELSYLESVLLSLSLCGKKEEFDEIETELTENGYIKQKNKAGAKKVKTPAVKIQKTEFEGYNIFYGKNNLQNDFLTKNSSTSDVWLHTKDIHGSHVVIQNKQSGFPNDNVILRAASIAAYHSKARAAGKTAVDYTFIKNVSKPNGAPPGKVVYVNYYTVYVEPREP